MQTVETPSFLILLLNFYGYFLPLILLAIWAPLALIDLSGRDDLSSRQGAMWAVAILGLPFVGAFAYHVTPGSRLPGWVRNYLVFGGLGLLVVFALLAMWFG